MEHSPSLANLLKAFAAAQGEMTNPINDSDNPHFRSKYASLAAVRNAVIPPLAAHGLSVMQFPTPDGDMIHCETILAHESGEFLWHTVSLPASATQQGYMGGATYAKRMALLALFVIAGDEDDDAEGAMGRGQAAPPRKEREKRPTPGHMSPKAAETPAPTIDPEEERRVVVVRNIASALKKTVLSWNHAGLYKAVLHHCFEAEHGTLADQPLAILEAGLPLFGHLCEALDAHRWERTQHPDEWIAQEQRALAAQVRGDAPSEEDTTQDDEGEGASWGSESRNLMEDEDDEGDREHAVGIDKAY